VFIIIIIIIIIIIVVDDVIITELPRIVISHRASPHAVVAIPSATVEPNIVAVVQSLSTLVR